MTPIQTQARTSPPNTLHDQGIPNTLARMSPSITASQTGVPYGVLAVAVVGALAASAIALTLLVHG